ncbi:retrovirus-related Pol polyprotein from transposon TNT 1-94 [Trichonephila clavipes]|nr:retrovirus-related Pol polyprotein from transposon TNT 1-94 [Trichonephila clavipes]
MDLCGPMPTESQGGNKYFLSIIDDYSRKVTVFPIRNKSDVFHTFVRFQKRAERFLSKKVIAVRTDGGLEFCNKDMDNFLTELGIKHEVTNSYTPEMNGVAERFNLTALDGIKTLLNSSEVPHKFWGEALLCFTYAWNRICHKDSNKTPFEKYSGRKPSVLHLKPFGCLAYAGVPKQIRKKFDMRVKIGIMMGYAQRTKGYRIWLIDENKLVETINDDSDRVKDSLTSRLVSKTSTETPSISEKPGVSSDNHNFIPCTEVKWIRNIGRKVTGSNVYYSIEGEATRLKSFNEIERYCKRHNIKYDPSIFNFRKDNIESQGFSDLLEQQEALMVEVTIPICYKQAIRSRDASKWHDAMDKEINVMMERKVWDLVDHPDNIKILENRWVYTIKYDENNKIVRYKARLVARERSSDEEFSSSESESDDDCLDSARDWCQIDVTSHLYLVIPKFPFTGNPGIKVCIGDSGDPLEYFNLFLDDEMFSFIVEDTNRYAESFFKDTELTPASRALKWKNANKKEMKRFIALLLLQGVVQKPVEKWFWSKVQFYPLHFFGNVVGEGALWTFDEVPALCK